MQVRLQDCGRNRKSESNTDRITAANKLNNSALLLPEDVFGALRGILYEISAALYLNASAYGSLAEVSVGAVDSYYYNELVHMRRDQDPLGFDTMLERGFGIAVRDAQTYTLLYKARPPAPERSSETRALPHLTCSDGPEAYKRNLRDRHGTLASELRDSADSVWHKVPFNYKRLLSGLSEVPLLLAYKFIDLSKEHIQPREAAGRLALSLSLMADEQTAIGKFHDLEWEGIESTIMEIASLLAESGEPEGVVAAVKTWAKSARSHADEVAM